MSNATLIEDLIRLGFRAGARAVLEDAAAFHLALAVRAGLAELTPAGRSRLTALREKLTAETDTPF